MIVLVLAAAIAQAAPQLTPPTLSSQSAFAEAFAKTDWETLKNRLAVDTKVSVYNPKAHLEKTVTGRDEAIALLSSVRPSLGQITVNSCEFSQMKFGPSVLCTFNSSDKDVQFINSLATLKGDLVVEFALGFSKKQSKRSPQSERGN